MRINWTILRNPWAVFGGLLSCIVLFGLALFFVQVVSYVGDIRAGEPDPFAMDDYTRRAKVILTRAPIAPEIRSRIESVEGNPLIGNPDAPIRIVEFLDYECPFCQRSAPEVRAFMSRNPDDVLLIIRDFPLESVHPNAMNAAIAAQCVFQNDGADAYWLYHDILYRNQVDLSVPALRTYAQTVRANLSAYDSCMDSRQPESRIKLSIQDAITAGARGTPTFYVNGYAIPGAVDLATLEALLVELKARL